MITLVLSYFADFKLHQSNSSTFCIYFIGNRMKRNTDSDNLINDNHLRQASYWFTHSIQYKQTWIYLLLSFTCTFDTLKYIYCQKITFAISSHLISHSFTKVIFQYIFLFTQLWVLGTFYNSVNRWQYYGCIKGRTTSQNKCRSTQFVWKNIGFWIFLHSVPTLSDLELYMIYVHCDDESCYFSSARPKLLVVSGADWRKSDPVPADSWLHVVRSRCPRADARPRLRTRAVPLGPGPLCLNYMEKHHARLGSTITSWAYVTAFG